MVGLVTAAIMIVASLAAPLLAWQDPSAQDLAGRLAPPSLAHWFGTDELGRDIYARILYGGRVTLGMVVAVVLLVAPVGLAVGSIAGYLGRHRGPRADARHRRLPGVSAPRAGAGLRRRAEARHHQRGDRHRADRLAAIRAAGARRDADRAQQPTSSPPCG